MDENWIEDYPCVNKACKHDTGKDCDLQDHCQFEPLELEEFRQALLKLAEIAEVD